MKLGSIQRYRFAGISGTAGLLAAFLGACASTPTDPVSERLDPDTAITVAVLNHPVELIAEKSRGALVDPFAYIAPFETDQAGKRTLLLWVSAPQAPGTELHPELSCDGQRVGLEPLENGLAQLGLSRAPYPAPDPWSGQWYFRLPAEGLKCLASAQSVSLETHAPEGAPGEFTAGGKDLAPLQAFSKR